MNPKIAEFSSIASAACVFGLVGYLGWEGIHAAVWNDSRPLLERPGYGDHTVVHRPPIDVMFYYKPDLKDDYVRAVNAIVARRPKTLGIFINGDGWEFPLWYLLRQQLRDSEMPKIVNEFYPLSKAPPQDMLFAVDFDKLGPVDPAGMKEIPGFGKVRLFERNPK
jgi:hypothetical protein